MSLQSTKDTIKTLTYTLGRGVLSSLYPDDFESYIFSLELVDSQDQTCDYFLFPINPSSISISENQLVNIKKTIGGLSSISADTYQSKVISIEGTFGRQLKLIIGRELVNFLGFLNPSQKSFSSSLKTGFGCCKILEKIIHNSNQLDSQGKPFFLYLYNLSFGESYLVKCVSSPTFHQSVEKNMIWSYSLKFQTLADLDMLSNTVSKSNITTFAFSQIQKSMNVILGKVETAILQ